MYIAIMIAVATSFVQGPMLTVNETQTLPTSWGKTYVGTIHSEVLGMDRRVNFYVPASFEKTQRKYPIVFLTDGEHYFQKAAIAVRELSEAGHIPECIVAAIETPERRKDMTPPGMSEAVSDGPEQRGDKFLRFIARELRPEMERTFRVSTPSILMGHSHGGILCTYAATKWRKDFPLIVSLDGPVQIDDEWLAKGLLSSVAEGGRLRLVSLEVKFGWDDKQWQQLTSTTPKTWKLSRIKMKAEDHESMVFAGFYDGLKEIFSDYSQVRVKGLGGQEAFAYYLQLESEYGGSITPPLYVLERAVRDLTFRGKGDLARKALKTWRDGYGNVPDYQALEAQIAESEKEMRGKETVEQLLALKPPTADDIKPYLGVWKGETWVSVDPDRRSEIKVTIALERGHGVVRIYKPNAPPEFQNETAKYLRVTPSGIEFGNMNGMDPRGIVAWVAKMQGDKMQGESLFRGVYFKRPPEMKDFHQYIALTRIR